MIILRSWLQEYVDVQDMDDHTLADTLTQLGLEVEEVVHCPPLDSRIVVGSILDVQPHPQADSLHLCMVNVGDGEDNALSIVCGASNVRVGMYVAVSKEGAVLPGGMKIRESRIRGELSCGMLCSAYELELVEQQDANDGILEIKDSRVKLGLACEQLFQYQDTKFDLAITPNRGDCLGYIGIARDIAAKLLRPFVKPMFSSVDQDKLAQYKAEFSTDNMLRVRCENSKLSGRFCALYIQGLHPGATSPYWLQRRLQLSGIRARNMVVDITNYVLLEWGQPVHAYDYASLGTKAQLVVREAGESSLHVTTLDGKQRTLHPKDIVIAGENAQICSIAGVMGGADSEICDKSTACVIEVAEFDATCIRNTCKRLKLSTEASYRFERGIDMSVLDQVAWRVGDLLCQVSLEVGLSVPKLASEMKDIYLLPYQTPHVALRVERVRKMLGWNQLQVDKCIDILDALECHLVDRKASRLVIAIPAHRHDLRREVDLIEEIARIKGYDHIHETLPTVPASHSQIEHPFIRYCDHARLSMASLGLKEAILYPFTSSQDYIRLGMSECHPLFPSISLRNPISSDIGYMQTLQFLPMLKALKQHRNHHHPPQKIFQLARVYMSQIDRLEHELESKDMRTLCHDVFSEYIGSATQCYHLGIYSDDHKSRPVEKTMLTVVIDSPWHTKGWNSERRALNFYDLKRIVERFLAMFSFGGHSYEILGKRASLFPYLNPKHSAMLVCDGESFGYLGLLHPEASEGMELGLDAIPGVIEICMEKLYALSRKHTSIYDEISSEYPACYRDISLAVSASVTHKQIMQAIDNFPKKKHLHSAHIFDLYVSDSIEHGDKSMAYSLAFLSKERTLKDREVDQELDALLKHLQETLSVHRR